MENYFTLSACSPSYSHFYHFPSDFCLFIFLPIFFLIFVLLLIFLPIVLNFVLVLALNLNLILNLHPCLSPYPSLKLISSPPNSLVIKPATLSANAATSGSVPLASAIYCLVCADFHCFHFFNCSNYSKFLLRIWKRTDQQEHSSDVKFLSRSVKSIK